MMDGCNSSTGIEGDSTLPPLLQLNDEAYIHVALFLDTRADLSSYVRTCKRIRASIIDNIELVTRLWNRSHPLEERLPVELSPIQTLPGDVIRSIASFLETEEELLHFALTCKHVNGQMGRIQHASMLELWNLAHALHPIPQPVAEPEIRCCYPRECRFNCAPVNQCIGHPVFLEQGYDYNCFHLTALCMGLPLLCVGAGAASLISSWITCSSLWDCGEFSANSYGRNAVSCSTFEDLCDESCMGRRLNLAPVEECGWCVMNLVRLPALLVLPFVALGTEYCAGCLCIDPVWCQDRRTEFVDCFSCYRG